jgi:hypothetical protein
MFIVASWEIGRISILCRDPAVTYCHYWVVYKTTITVFTLLWARLLWTFISVWGPLPELPEFGFYPSVPKWRKFEENREKLPVFNFDVTKQACMCMCANFCIFIYSYVIYTYYTHMAYMKLEHICKKNIYDYVLLKTYYLDKMEIKWGFSKGFSNTI